VSLSDEEFSVSDVTPEAVTTTGRMMASSSIQTASTENLRFVINRPSFPKELTFPFDMVITPFFLDW
jgi:hypothetical protein